MKHLQRKTVFVGLSGGVDSSVSAAILKEQGYRVVGVFMRTWQPQWMSCTWRQERRDAMRVAAQLEIPFLECDLEEVYKEKVAQYMIDEYSKGRTPNPDVMCNKMVKFGAFYDWAMRRGADFVATGHYAQTTKTNDQWFLSKGKDPSKDQTYFLWTMDGDVIEKTLFPVGGIAKKKTREIAEKLSLLVAKKKDSQGVCFLGPIDLKEFLSHYIEQEEGDVLDTSGNVIGKHPGALFFTLRQRHGFVLDVDNVNQDILYVSAKNMKDNTITVASKKHLEKLQKEKSDWVKVTLSQSNIRGFGNSQDLTAQSRYHGTFYPVDKVSNLDNKICSVVVKMPDLDLALGQSLVLYDGGVCLGGGVIEGVFSDIMIKE